MSSAAVAKVRDILIPIVEPAVIGLAVPDVSGSTKVTGLTIHYTISNIKIQQFSFGQAGTVLIPPSEVGVDLPNTQCVVQMDWSYKAYGLHGSGSATDTLGLEIQAIGALYDQGGRLMAKAKSVSVNINDININVHGGNSWFYQVVVNIFKSKIKGTIEDALETELKGMINSLANYYLKGKPVYPVSDDLLIDYGLTETPNITPRWSETSSRGEFLSSQISFRCPILPTELPDSPLNSPLTLYLGDSMGSCLGSLMYKTSSMSYTITDKSLPKNSPVRLNTGDRNMKKLFPDLYQTFPDVPITLKTYAVSPPTVQVNEAAKSVAVTFYGIVNVTVLWNETGVIEMVEAFAVNLKLITSAHISILTAPVTAISGKIVDVNHTVSLQSSRVANVSMDSVNNLVQFFVAAGVEPQLNKLLTKGIPLPQTSGVELVSPRIVYGNGYLGVETDFSYNPSGAKSLMMARMAERNVMTPEQQRHTANQNMANDILIE
jgi:hypothetical protein